MSWERDLSRLWRVGKPWKWLFWNQNRCYTWLTYSTMSRGIFIFLFFVCQHSKSAHVCRRWLFLIFMLRLFYFISRFFFRRIYIVFFRIIKATLCWRWNRSKVFFVLFCVTQKFISRKYKCFVHCCFHFEYFFFSSCELRLRTTYIGY